MVLLRRVIGDALRARRRSQHRTLREVSTAANVSLGYLSEIERGQKEASSELLSAICVALGAHLSDLLREASDTVALAEQMDSRVFSGVPAAVVSPERAAVVPDVDSGAPAAEIPAATPAGPAGPAPDGRTPAGRTPAPGAPAPDDRAPARDDRVPAPVAVSRNGPSRPAGGRPAAPSRPFTPNRPAAAGRGVVPRPAAPARPVPAVRGANAVAPRASAARPPLAANRASAADGSVSITVRHDTPLRTTLLATRTPRVAPATRDILYSR